MTSLAEKAAEERAEAREKVAAAARSGRLPSVTFKREDLGWCFAGHMDELEQLEQVARDKLRRAHRVEETSRQRAAVKRETERVLGEWDATRRAEAEAEARRRLGFDEASS